MYFMWLYNVVVGSFKISDSYEMPHSLLLLMLNAGFFVKLDLSKRKNA